MRARALHVLSTLFIASAVVASGAAPASASGGGSPVYRFWSNDSKAHFYTSDLNERNLILRTYGVNQWRYEGAVYTASPTLQPGMVPLYRFFSQEFSGHFFTTDENEKNQVIDLYDDSTWLFENIAFYVYPSDSAAPSTVPVARFWSPDNRHHFYTSDAVEAEFTKTHYPPNVWTYENDNFRVSASSAIAAPMINAKDCGNFPNWYEANAWFQFYFPEFGDVAQLDDGDGVPCEALPGAP